MNRAIFSSCLFLAFLVGASAHACDQDSIETVSSNGAVIVMLSGSVYRVDAIGQIDTALWLPIEDVLVCNDEKIINTDQDGEEVTVTRLR